MLQSIRIVAIAAATMIAGACDHWTAKRGVDAGGYGEIPADTAEQLNAVISQRISECWLVPKEIKGREDLAVVLNLILAQDGTVQRAAIVSTSQNAGDPLYDSALGNVFSALEDPTCVPIAGLPLDQYHYWRNVTVRFDPSDPPSATSSN